MDNLPAKRTIRVLDCFHGQGTIWRNIDNRLTNKKIIVLGIDKNKDFMSRALVGDNVRYLATMDLSQFDIIDLDAWGVPFRQLQVIANNPTSAGCLVFATLIQARFAGLPKKMLSLLGYTPNMVNKVPLLFRRNGIEKWLQYLALYDIKWVKLYSDKPKRKHYMAFVMPGKGRK